MKTMKPHRLQHDQAQLSYQKKHNDHWPFGFEPVVEVLGCVFPSNRRRPSQSTTNVGSERPLASASFGEAATAFPAAMLFSGDVRCSLTGFTISTRVMGPTLKFGVTSHVWVTSFLTALAPESKTWGRYSCKELDTAASLPKRCISAYTRKTLTVRTTQN